MLGVVLAMPAQAAATAAGPEVALHIVGTGSVMADYAVVQIPIAVQERGRPAAEAAFQARVADLKAQLAKSGVPASALTVGPVTFEEAQSDAPSNRFGFAEAVMLQKPMGGAPDPAEAEEVEVPSPTPDADLAQANAQSARDAARQAARKVEAKRKLPYVSASADATLRIDNLAAFGKLSTGGMGDGAMPRNADFKYTQPDTVHARAVAAAVADARREADIYARSLGYHVVRITGVSNIGPAVSAKDFYGFVTTLDRRGDPWQVKATHSAQVTLDMIIAPD
jgi:uncharacterized protein YggE